MRLESDADLVKVVTIHKSKGLEYPYVMLPFVTCHKPVDSSKARYLELAGDEGKRRLLLSSVRPTLRSRIMSVCARIFVCSMSP